MTNNISIVILNYNGRRFLDSCISSLEAQIYRDFEVILVDNGSSDDSASYVREKFPFVKVVETGCNLGFAGGTNAGIREAAGEFIITLNNDCIAEPDFLAEMAHAITPRSADDEPFNSVAERRGTNRPRAYAASNGDRCGSSAANDDGQGKGVGMWAARMIRPNGRIDSAGICISRSGAAWDRLMLQEDVAAADRAEEVFGPCAGAAMYRKEMLLDIGLFDEDFFLYMEDVDLAMRGRLAGWRCMYVPFAKVVHHHGGTAGEGSDLTIFYGNRNIIWYTVKCLPAGLLLAYLPWIVCRNIAVMVHYMALGKGQLILKSKLSALVGLPRMVRKRKAVVRRAQSNEIARFINTWAAIPRR